MFLVAEGRQGRHHAATIPTVDGSRASEVYFENVAVGADALIGADGRRPAADREGGRRSHRRPLRRSLRRDARAARGTTLEYAKQRKQFGVPIGNFQVLQHRMVDMFIEVEQAVSMTYMATLKLTTAAERAKAVSAAKVQIGKAGKFVGQNAVQIHGGMGMTDELAIGHYFKRATMIESAVRLDRPSPGPLRAGRDRLIALADLASCKVGYRTIGSRTDPVDIPNNLA